MSPTKSILDPNSPICSECGRATYSLGDIPELCVWCAEKLADKAVEKLLERYANGRQLCNCRRAYYSTNEQGQRCCKGGCSSNQISARKEVALRVVKEFEI